jgi:hypothetical protein
MARGGYGGRGVPLHARTRPDDTALASVAASACPVKHCWVTVPVDGGEPRPGLLLEWRKGVDGRWEGRVVYGAELRPGRWATVEEWIGEALLDPR